MIEDYLADAFERYGFPKAGKFISTAIEKDWLLLLLDGLDEVPVMERPAVAGRIRDFLQRVRSCPAIITCRSAVYQGELAAVTNRTVEIAPFEDQQIQTFLDSWTDPMPAGKSPAQLMAALREQPLLLGAARNPLLLTIITHLYSDSPSYVLPRSRAEFYRQAAAILLEQWQGHLGQNKFDAPEKRALLSALAIEMQEGVRGRADDRRTITRERAVEVAAALMPNLGREVSQVSEILREVVERSGLLLAIDGGAAYAFAHLTFQEYCAAEALLNRPDDLLAEFKQDSDTWREVVILWCGLVTDSTNLIREIKNVDRDVALACTAEAASVDDGLAQEILDPIYRTVAAGEADVPTQKALGAVAADVKPRGNRVFEALVVAFQGAVDRREITSLAVALSASNRAEAASEIVRRLPDHRELVTSIISLGDLSVGPLQTLAQESAAREACYCLVEIGTPDAARALVDIMRESKELSSAAAWGVAKLVGDPLVVRRLSSEMRASAWSQSSDLDWIWKPFCSRGDVLLPRIVGRASELVWQSHDLNHAIATPDGRISAALCGMEAEPLATPLSKQHPFQQAIRTANKAMTSGELRWTENESMVFKPKKGGSWSASERLQLGIRMELVKSVGDLLVCVSNDLSEEVRRDWESRRQPRQLSGRVIEQVDEKWDRVVRACFDAIPNYSVWKRLVLGMPTALRRTFLVRMSSGGSINRENWQEVRAIAPFRFERSRWYAAVLLILGAVSIAAIMFGIGLVLTASGTEAWLAAVGIFSIVYSWLRMRLSSLPRTGLAGIETFEVIELLIAPIGVVVELSEGDFVEALVFLPAALFAPSCAWLVGSGLANWVGVSWAIVVLAMVTLIGGTLAYVGVRKERVRKMPLAGLFSNGVLRALSEQSKMDPENLY
jgi:hypothetical protein